MRTKEQIIAESMKEGYTLLESGIGCYDAPVANYRSQGYDVRYWYMTREKDVTNRKYEIYGLMKSIKKNHDLVSMPNIEELAETKKEYPDYASMTVKELREICKQKHVKNYSKMSKSDIVEELKKVG